jgi:hypothetical protein
VTFFATGAQFDDKRSPGSAVDQFSDGSVKAGLQGAVDSRWWRGRDEVFPELCGGDLGLGDIGVEGAEAGAGETGTAKGNGENSRCWQE